MKAIHVGKVFDDNHAFGHRVDIGKLRHSNGGRVDAFFYIAIERIGKQFGKVIASLVEALHIGQQVDTAQLGAAQADARQPEERYQHHQHDEGQPEGLPSPIFLHCE